MIGVRYLLAAEELSNIINTITYGDLTVIAHLDHLVMTQDSILFDFSSNN